MLIGFDFDNTIVCYDSAISTLASEIIDLPRNIPRTKLEIRDHLRSVGREKAWTEFQGLLYGPGMRFAQTFEGVVSTMQRLILDGHELSIVSHRSKHPYAGPAHDLHAFAQQWVEEHLRSVGLFLDTEQRNNVAFHETLEAKISNIAALNCDMFIDDLPEVLDAPGFPSSTIGIHFEPNGEHITIGKRIRLRAWHHLPDLLLSLK